MKITAAISPYRFIQCHEYQFICKNWQNNRRPTSFHNIRMYKHTHKICNKSCTVQVQTSNSKTNRKIQMYTYIELATCLEVDP